MTEQTNSMDPKKSSQESHAKAISPNVNSNKIAEMDHRYSWHPFTQMKDWMTETPVIIEKGEGPWLIDNTGQKFLDANASIWTNIHGHNQPDLNQAIHDQLSKVAHVSYLGLAHEPGARLAAKLTQASAPEILQRTFFSDDGSTAIEAGLKMTYEAARRLKGIETPRFLSLAGAYHGDTVGSVSLGQVPAFHQSFRGLLFEVDKVMNPACYRCPFNKARFEAGHSSVTTRKCQWECITQIESACDKAMREKGHSYSGFFLEPTIQGVAGMIAQPEGWLKKACEVARHYGSWLIFDEILTGFGRTGPMFAFQDQSVVPDVLCVAKGLSGGYLPLAATLTTNEIFSAFLGEYEEMKTFFHGHSYTANPLGCAAAIRNLELLESLHDRIHRDRQGKLLKEALHPLWDLEMVGDIRQTGTVAGIELVRDRSTRLPFEWQVKAGVKVCRKLATKGILTRPIGNVIVVMLPYCAEESEFRQLSEGIYQAIEETAYSGELEL